MKFITQYKLKRIKFYITPNVSFQNGNFFTKPNKQTILRARFGRKICEFRQK